MPLSVLAGVYDRLNQEGNQRYYAVPSSVRYDVAHADDLRAANLYQAISSVLVGSTIQADSSLILFSQGNFLGRFLQLTNARSGQSLVTDLVPYGFDNQATSLILVAAHRQEHGELRLSFRDMFLEEWRTTLDREIGNEAIRNGDPILTWLMFPQGGLDPNLIYLEISQGLIIQMPFWPNYRASIFYDIRLFLDEAHHLQGNVASSYYAVEPGLKRAQIEARLRPKVESGAQELNNRLAARVAAVANLTLSDLYYLPGRQLQLAPTGALTGWTTDDVTIVLEY